MSARSLNGVATLGVRCGDELIVTATGRQAARVLTAMGRLAEEGFGEPEDLGVGAAEAPEPAEPCTPPRVAASPTSADVIPAAPPAAGAVLVGVPGSPGAAVGPARRLGRAAPELPDSPAGDPATEWAALERALEATADDVLRTRASVATRTDARDAAIFDAHLLFLEDEALLGPAREGSLRPRRGGGWRLG